MGWFKKDSQKEDEVQELPDLPKLPELPRIPEKKRETSRLPSFPNSSIGDKFSQNSIKEAVMGKEEVEEEADDFAEEEQMMPEPPKRRVIDEVPEEFREASRKVKEAEHLFIRIDKFEEGMRTFESIKNKIEDIETMIKETRKIKDDEEKELQSWESKIKTVKLQIEKIDREIFSKVE